MIIAGVSGFFPGLYLDFKILTKLAISNSGTTSMTSLLLFCSYLSPKELIQILKSSYRSTEDLLVTKIFPKLTKKYPWWVGEGILIFGA